MTSSATRKDEKLVMTDTTIVCNYETLESCKQESKDEVTMESSKIEEKNFVSLPPGSMGGKKFDMGTEGY